MTTAGVTTSVDDALARYGAVVNELQNVDQDGLSADDVLELLRGIETQQRRLLAVQHAAIAQLETRSVAFERGAKNTATLLKLTLRISGAEAGGRVKAARRLAARRTVAGLPVEPEYPVVAAAQVDGAIGAAHAKVITDVMATLPDEVLDVARQEDEADRARIDGADVAAAGTVGEWLERYLTDQARETDPQQLAQHARQLCAALDQDGLLREYDYRVRNRSLDLHVRVDGSSSLRAELTAEATERLLTQLDVLGRPLPAVDGVPDSRSATQRRHDGFTAMLRLVERAELLPDCAGVSATLVLTMDADTYATGEGLATTGHGYRIPADRAKGWLSAETKIIAVLLSKTKGIEAYSSTQRIATEQQRLALLARDQGCIAPGCDAPLLWTEAHHVTDWKDTRRTCVDDLTLLCGRNHEDLIAAGYTVRMIHGRPWLVPPKWIDPEQKPVRNTLHD